MKDFTPHSTSQIRIRRAHAQPAESTLEFLRNYARTYSPKDDLNGSRAALVLQ
jgi:hypothetical protein